MANPNEFETQDSVESANSTKPLKDDMNNSHARVETATAHHDNGDHKKMLTSDSQDIKLEFEETVNTHTTTTTTTSNAHEEHARGASDAYPPPQHTTELPTAVQSGDDHKQREYSHSEHDNDSVVSSTITHQTQTDASLANKAKSQDALTIVNPFDTTQVRHDGDDVEIGAISDIEDDNSPVIQPYNGGGHEPRMPSISFNNADQLAVLRRASRRKWWSPTRICDWCMHKLFFGKVMVMVLTWTTVVDYSKDLYVAYHLGVTEDYIAMGITLAFLFLSLRLMLYLRAIDDSGVSFWKLLIFYLPGSVCADFQIDRFSDVGVCLFWEVAILLGTPFVPFYLVWLALRKSVSLFSCCSKDKTNYENPYLLSYAVVECLFETIPQLILQSYLYVFGPIHRADGRPEIELFVFIVAWIVSLLVLIKIPVVVWYNWRIVYKLSFKRRHAGEITTVKYHPIRDLIATGSWDHTVLINSIIDASKLPADDDRDAYDDQSPRTPVTPPSPPDYERYESKEATTTTTSPRRINQPDIKAKRVLDHHYNINCIAWMPKFLNSLYDAKSDIIAVAGHGVELFNWRSGKSMGQFPKNRERDALRRKKRQRTKEVKEVLFSPDGRRLIWCQGKSVFVYDWDARKELAKIRCMQRNQMGDVNAIDISPNGKYIACALYQNQIKVYNSYNKDLIRVLEGHTAPVNSVKFDRQGKYVISGGSDCKVRVFDLRFGEQIKQFDYHTADVLCVAIDYSNRFIASAGRDNMLYVTYLDDEDRRRSKHLAPQQQQQQQQQRQKSQKDSKDGTAKTSSTVPTSRIKPMRMLTNWAPYQTQREIRCVDFSPYGEHVCCASEDHQVHVLRLPHECHSRAHKLSMDLGHALQKEVQHPHTPNAATATNKHDPGDIASLNNTYLQEIVSNDELSPDPSPNYRAHNGNVLVDVESDADQLQMASPHERQFSNLEAITTNDYKKFDPKEHTKY
eukprot:CAMPEP_0202695666 /NCGR_PEP_ID=MMETSP1385-20130828/9215_1 /ASSEMBLY_ACC=CAM_ASM_000861 /TAXON_ID=933848 /ORGANISM="Elphidium margaritaceum" /LENGTH=964 /DNA_ID=CAMNT_0049351737 /DNA_START=45 /DNA_END=2939 /DNA_ORIENTATION=+